MTDSPFVPGLYFAVAIDDQSGFVSCFNDVPGGYVVAIDIDVYTKHVASHDHLHDQRSEPEKYFKAAGLDKHPSYKKLTFQELFETSHEGQKIMAKEMASLLARNHPKGIPHRIVKYLMDRVMDDASHAMARAEVACDQYQEESEEDVVAKMLALLLQTRRMESILDADGNPSNV